ncbi:hypothetical protein P9139_20940 [Curtobacterium flaccumfaciens]|nr:hypothetical protein P9139_20940 [Curtobacterium flaccumfaciens]
MLWPTAPVDGTTPTGAVLIDRSRTAATRRRTWHCSGSSDSPGWRRSSLRTTPSHGSRRPGGSGSSCTSFAPLLLHVLLFGDPYRDAALRAARRYV